MELIQRNILDTFKSKLFKGKVVILYGPRQAGKTTFVQKICSQYDGYKYINCDEAQNSEALSSKSAYKLKEFIGNNKLIVLDEAQMVDNIGLTLKILVDTYPHIQIVATGSFAFDLENRLAEPLTGRHYDFIMLPPSYAELRATGIEHNLENRILYGSYPEIIFPLDNDTPRERICSIASDYALKDVLAFSGVRKSSMLNKLLKILAYQMSQEVSFNEISANLGMSVQTVQTYINILEKAFIVFMLNPYSGNSRTALRRKQKIYFYDTGLRNAIINNFDPLDVRADKGALFENYIISEMYKKNINSREPSNLYFYRSYDGEEIDLVTQSGSHLIGYECKYSYDKEMITKGQNAPVHNAHIISKDSLTRIL